MCFRNISQFILNNFRRSQRALKPLKIVLMLRDVQPIRSAIVLGYSPHSDISLTRRCRASTTSSFLHSDNIACWSISHSSDTKSRQTDRIFNFSIIFLVFAFKQKNNAECLNVENARNNTSAVFLAKCRASLFIPATPYIQIRT